MRRSRAGLEPAHWRPAPARRGWGVEKHQLRGACGARGRSHPEAVQGGARAAERVEDVGGGDCAAMGVLRVGHGVADDALQEGLWRGDGGGRVSE